MIQKGKNIKSFFFFLIKRLSQLWALFLRRYTFINLKIIPLAEIEAIPFKILSKTSLMSLQKYRSSYKFSDNEFKRGKQLSKK